MKVFHTSFQAMGTRCDVVLPGITSQKGDNIAQQIKNQIAEIELVLSHFDKNSEVYKLNEAKPDTALPISSVLSESIELCQQFYHKTNGYFDVGLGKVHKKIAASQWTTNADQQLWNEATVSNLVINNQTVNFKNKNTEINFGAFGKGYALAQIKRQLQSELQSGLINFGDSSILAFGNHPHGSYWPVGIRNLHDLTQSIFTFQLNSSSVSTSGMKKGKNTGFHVLNPTKQNWVKKNKTITVQSEDPVISEVLSTALLCIDDQSEIKSILSNFNNCKVLEVDYSNEKPVLNTYTC